MADVFLSYSRTDSAFVRRLEEALAAIKRDVWVDWEDIPLTAEWLEEIYSGIEQADNFVFVLSPESVASPTCQKEVSHAVASNKRIIPILHRPVPDSAIPEALGQLNWIFFRESDAFETTFASLVEALDTDLEWKRTHSRLLVRARDWERAGREKSVLLRGRDLREAEEWQARAVRDVLTPTPLHSQYILASRQAERRRQAWQLGAAAVAILVSTGLAVAAYIQRNVALRQAAIATSRQLAAQSTALVETKPDLALLLALEASASDDNFDSRGALFTALRTRPRLTAFLRGVGETATGAQPIRLSAAAFSRDGKMIAAASGLNSNQIQIWNAATMELMATLDGHTAPIYSVAFAADGRRLLSGGADQRLFVWDVQSGKPLANFTEHTGSITSVAVSADGKAAASADDNKLVILWDLERQSKIGEIRTSGSSGVTHLMFRGADLVTVGTLPTDSSDNQITEFWDIATRQRRGRPFAQQVLAFSRDFKLYATVRYGDASGASKSQSASLAFTGPTDTAAARLQSQGTALETVVTVYEAGSGKPMMAERVPDNALVTDAEFGRGNSWFAFGVGSEIHLWKLDERQILAPMRQPDIADSVAFSPDGGSLVSTSWDGSVAVWSIDGQGTLSRELTKGVSGLLAFSADGRTLAAATTDEVVTVETNTGQLLKRDGVAGDGAPGSLRALSFGPQGVMLTVKGRGEARLFSLRESTGFPDAVKQASAIAFHPSGAGIAVGLTDGDIVLWDPSTSQPRWSANTITGGAVTALAFDHSGKELAAGYNDGTIAFWDAASGQRRTAHMHAFDATEPPAALAYRPDDRSLLVIGNREMSLWDTTTDTRLNALANQDGVGAQLLGAFSPDASLLAWSTLAFRDVNVVDASARQRLGPPLRYTTGAPDTYVTGLAFSPDGRRLATAYSHWVSSIASSVEDGIVLWNFDVAEWNRSACAIANRNLTPAEWSQYLAPAPYRTTCKLPADRPQVSSPPPSVPTVPATVATHNAMPVTSPPVSAIGPKPATAAPTTRTASPSSCADPDACRSECSSGSAAACYRLGDIEMRGGDDARAARSFERACDGGDARGCHELAGAYLSGQGVVQDFKRSETLAEKACDGGVAASCWRLALVLSGGFGTPRDDVRAAHFNQRGCDLGNASACASLGEAYSAGRGVTREDVRAATLLAKGCDGGIASACTSLGRKYAAGAGVPRDDVRAAALYRRACDDTRGLFSTGGDGCRHLAAAYEEGRGVDKDIAQAIALYKRACNAIGIGQSKEACKDLKRLEAR